MRHAPALPEYRAGRGSQRLAEAWLIALIPAAGLGPLLGLGPLFMFRVLLVIGILAGAIATRRRDGGPLVGAALLLALFLVTSSAITWFWPGWPSEAILDLASFVASLLGAAAALVLIPRARRLSALARGIVLLLLLEAVVVLWEVISGQHLPTFALTWEDDRYMAVWFMMAGTFTNPNQLGQVCVVAFPIALWYALARGPLLWRVTAGAAATAVLPMAWLTQSRTALLVLAAELVVIALLWRGGRIAAAVVGVIVTGVFTFSPALRSVVTDSFADKDPLGADNPRVDLALNGLDMLRATFGLGVGPGGYASWSQHRDLPYETSGLTNPHNAVLEVASQYGLGVSLAFVVFFLATGWWALRRLPSSSASERCLAAMTLAVLVLWPLIGLANSHWMPLSWSMVEIIVLFVVADALRPDPPQATVTG